MKNVDPLDDWTLTHILAGIVARKIGMKRNDFLALVLLYELVEVSRPPESIANRLLDVAANYLGWELGARF